MKYSIVTICYNAENQISKTINSVLNLDSINYEYIIIDGNSTDQTLEIIASYEDLFAKKGIIYRYVSENDKGISDAFNKGIMLSSGNYVGLINAGDAICKDSLNIIDEFADNDDEIIYGNILWQDEGRGYSYVRKSQLKVGKLKYEMVIMHPSVFVLRSLYEKYGGFREDFKYCMDQELLYRFFKNGCKFKYIDRVIAEMCADGVSDRKVWPVLVESSKVARLYHKNNLITYFFVLYKYLKNRIAHLVRHIQYGKKIENN